MHIRILFISILVALMTHISFSQGRGLGFGLVIGNPTGVSCKAWVAQYNALQFGVGWPSLSRTNGTVLSAEYLWHSHVIRSREQFPLFYGFGGVLGISSGNSAFGIEGACGIAWWPRNSSLDVFLQLMPTLFVSPSAKFEFNGGIGVRYFF